MLSGKNQISNGDECLNSALGTNQDKNSQIVKAQTYPIIVEGRIPFRVTEVGKKLHPILSIRQIYKTQREGVIHNLSNITLCFVLKGETTEMLRLSYDSEETGNPWVPRRALWYGSEKYIGEIMGFGAA